MFTTLFVDSEFIFRFHEINSLDKHLALNQMHPNFFFYLKLILILKFQSHKAYIFSDSWHHRPKSVMNSGFENIEEKYSNDIAKSKMRSSPISNNLSDLNEIRHENRRHRKSPIAFNKFKHNFYDREQYKRMSQLEIERHFSSVKKHSGDTNVFTDNRSYTNSSRGDSIEHQKTIYSHSLSDIRNSEQPDRAIYPFDVHYSMNDIQGIMDHLDKMIAGSSRDNSQVIGFQ